MKYKAVLFDFDYTLGDSTDPIVDAARSALREMGFPREPEREAVRRTIGHSLYDAYTMLTGDPDPGNRGVFYHTFRVYSAGTMVPGTVLFPDAVPLLRTLHGQGIRLGIVSTKGHRALDGVAERFGISGLLECIIAIEDVSVPKPDPQGLLEAMGRTGTAPEETLYVGDTVIDAETAKNAGVDFAAVCTGTTPAEAFGVWPSVCVAESLSRLGAFLRSL